ncbi:pyridoxamine 5'-phosphate oxidase family protein [Salininema proteolyticum]|uniref:Pyridoxamine 5'-phosphate oxidase family protein n=1 Tax=Salininema proteolyticum TaxID=1607685 RepID=A0ABV8TVB3_9ACTN
MTRESSTGTWTAIEDEGELRDLVGHPAERAATKDRSRLLPIDREWLANSPFCVLATSDAEGNCDASPKGDPRGLIHVLDDETVVVPERKGNKRMDGFFNVLRNPHVGIISLIPGRGETLRINGRATIVRDAPFFDDLVVKGHRPDLALVVEIDQVFFHCAKAFMRSRLWSPETWEPEVLPSTAELVKSSQNTPESLESLEEHYGAQYASKLYLTSGGPGSRFRRTAEGPRGGLSPSFAGPFGPGRARRP